MVTGEWYFPDNLLDWFQFIIDVSIIIPFILILCAILYARKNFPLFEKKGILLSSLGFSILGILSSIMDAIDEMYWFLTPENFYREVWKPIRLGLILTAIGLLLVTFFQFYKYAFRFIDKETE